MDRTARTLDTADEVLIATKLRAPAVRSQVMPRPSLMQQLDDASQRVLTLVAAPAGFGKTSLLNTWRQERDKPVAWVSLDAGDNDPVRFWTYTLTALEEQCEGAVELALAMLRAPQLPPMQALLASVVNALNQNPQALTLVLDDYHLITHEAIHEALAWFLEQLPPTFHFIIASRSDPPLPLARWRARASLLELRAPELRFAREEVSSFLTEVQALSLEPTELRQLEERTEGWPAGLQLAALSLKGSADPGLLIAKLSGSQRHILDYLLEEVLEHQPPERREFLLTTSILRTFCASLCDAVSGREDSQAVLEQLEADNLFLVPLDEDRRWYRYHHLFAEALAARLEQQDPKKLAEVHGRASRWFEAHGWMSDAARHALAFGEAERAASLVAAEAPVLLKRGETETLERWLRSLPEEVIAANPRLCAVHAWVLLFKGEFDKADARLEQAAAQEPDDDVVRGEVLAVRAFIIGLRMRPEEAFALSREALELLPEDHMLRDLAVMTLASEDIFSGHPEKAAEAFSHAAQLSRQQGNRFGTVFALYQAAEATMLQGKLRQAAEIYREAERAATLPSGQALPIIGMAWIGLGEVHREWNKLEEAERYFTEGIKLCAQTGELTASDGLGWLARLRHAKGEHDKALDTLEEVARVLESMDTPEVRHAVAWNKARLWVWQGHLDVAAHWKKEVEHEADTLLIHVGEQVHLTLARVELAQGKPSAALSRLERLRPPALEAKRMISVLSIMLLQALALEAQGKTHKALELLSSALTFAEPEGFVRLFADEGASVAALLVKLRAAREVEPGIFAGWTPTYLDALLDAFDEEALALDGELPEEVEALSERELEVLRHIAVGGSNKQVAKALDIAPSTVKWYVNTIFGKLQVKSRTQAVARARELGML